MAQNLIIVPTNTTPKDNQPKNKIMILMAQKIITSPTNTTTNDYFHN